MNNDYIKSCEDMRELIESCWDENNPDDSLTFDERLSKKMQNLDGIDREIMKMVIT